MPDWGFQILSAAAGLAGLLLLYWALCRDRSRGRRRCPKCWYDLRGSETLTCSECGYTAKRERQFFKTRRRWRWVAVVVVIGCGAAALWLTPRARRDGWLTLMPTTIVIASLQWTGEDGVEIINERWFGPPNFSLQKREVWGWQLQFAAWQASRMLGGNQPSQTRLAMLDLLLWLDDTKPVGRTLLTWLSDPDVGIVMTAAYYLNEASIEDVDPAAIVSRLCEMSDHPLEQVRIGAANGGRRFVNSHPEVVNYLFRGLSDGSVAVRSVSAYSLESHREASREIVDALCGLLTSGDQAGAAAAWALGHVGDATTVPVLLMALDSRYSFDCARSLLALGQEARSPEAATALAALLERTDPQIRGAAVASLMGQGEFARPHVGRMVEVTDLDSGIATMMILSHQPVSLTADAAVPVLCAIIEECEKGVLQTQPLPDVDRAFQLLGQFPEHADATMPLVLRMLAAPGSPLRNSPLVAILGFGPRAAAALPVLEARLAETTNPYEKDMLKSAMAAINRDAPDR